MTSSFLIFKVLDLDLDLFCESNRKNQASHSLSICGPTIFHNSLYFAFEPLASQFLTMATIKESDGSTRTICCGSVLSARIEDPITINVHAGSSFSLSTASSSQPTVLLLKTSKNEPFLEFAMFPGGPTTLCGLGLVWEGPQSLQLRAREDGLVNIFGSVTGTGTTLSTENTTTDETVNQKSVVSSASDQLEEKAGKKKKKRKLQEENEAKPIFVKTKPPPDGGNEKKPRVSSEEEKKDDDAPQQLTKNQRRKLAKQKSKELADEVAKLNQHEKKKTPQTPADDKKTKKISLTKPRRLPNGVYVRDLVVGIGNVVKMGRKVSILYEGTFPDSGKVFDKNNNKASPLVFRQGTGQVVKGLDKGMEGMRVGGSREITIPPELGYGKKGSGPVPPNATLQFSVEVLKVG